jgi:hypothetical protein
MILFIKLLIVLMNVKGEHIIGINGCHKGFDKRLYDAWKWCKIGGISEVNDLNLSQKKVVCLRFQLPLPLFDVVPCIPNRGKE